MVRTVIGVQILQYAGENELCKLSVAASGRISVNLWAAFQYFKRGLFPANQLKPITMVLGSYKTLQSLNPTSCVQSMTLNPQRHIHTIDWTDFVFIGVN